MIKPNGKNDVVVLVQVPSWLGFFLSVNFYLLAHKPELVLAFYMECLYNSCLHYWQFGSELQNFLLPAGKQQNSKQRKKVAKSKEVAQVLRDINYELLENTYKMLEKNAKILV